MKATILCIAVAALFSSCSKMAEDVIDKGISSTNNSSQFIKYTIQQGKQYCDQSGYTAVDTKGINFAVKFDSSAIYQTRLADNQNDINKLFGFSDNSSDHHQFSARFGWRWSEGSLRLFAYVYNQGVRVSKELTTISIGTETNCSIRVKGNQYVFTVNGTSAEMPRMSTTEKSKGYQLYPYFGGDEVAPHEVNIWIRMLDEDK